MSDRRPFLYDAHVALGAKVVPFGGWEMPLAYPGGTLAEHLACRRGAVVFDVSHLGTVRVSGPGSRETLQSTLTNDLDRVAPGRAQYTHLLTEDGFVVDDIIVWWVADESFDVMPNASNTAGVRGAVGGEDVTAGRTVLAVQGPAARERLARVDDAMAGVGRFRVATVPYRGVEVRVAGTGYTGEDGVEIAAANEVAEALFDEVLAAGVEPAGLGARDTLRLEAGLPLYGHELSATSTTLQARLGWVLGWDKPAFRGRAAVEAERARGVTRLLAGVVADTRQPLREGATVRVDGRVVGELSSGNYSPVLERGVGLGLLEGDWPVGTRAGVELRGREVGATIAALPLVARGR